ncbi:MAG: NAD(P)-dependent oxidoreductase [Rhodospirillaceae bacterium]|nr:NAD(P)-dependent oxidoreductase [Rhodospirillaceae bacterium]
METVVVTGANSYLGIALVERLSQMNISVHIVARPKSDISRLIQRAPSVNIHNYNGKQSSLEKLLEESRPDTIFHLAGKYYREDKPEYITSLIDSNITFGSQLLLASLNSSVKNFINTGSYFQFSGHNESAVNFYGATKNSFNEILNYYSSLEKFLPTTLIIFDTFGPNDWRQKLFQAITEAVKTNEVMPIPAGNVPMYPVYIADVIDCYILAAQKLASKPNEIINKCFAVRGSKETSIKEIIRIFEQVTNKKIYTEIGAWPASTREIKNIWRGSTMSDWRPKHNLAKGIEKMLEGHNENN